jgi:hypothetical protein
MDRNDPKDLKPDDRPAPPAGAGSPYGPQYDHVDEAAGGADSSPFEDQPSGRKSDAARAPDRRGGGPGKPPG